MPYKPPYTLTSDMLKSVSQITQLIGKIEGYQLLTGNIKLRRQNKIKTIRSSLAIEGNTLTEGEITDIVNGKPVMGSPREILEVKNALKVYDTLVDLDPDKEDDLLDSHGLLMKGLIDDAGRYRNSGVGVIDGEKVIHIGPPPNMVPRLMGDLFDYQVNYPEETILKSCVFHYEFEFIHPFSDGNGRMGRLWQTVILKRDYPILTYVPFETIVHQRQAGYYQALSDSQSLGNSNPFIYFMLDALRTALETEADKTGEVPDPESRLLAFREYWKLDNFSRKDYQTFHKTISTSTASRDLLGAVENGTLLKEGEQRNTRYRFH